MAVTSLDLLTWRIEEKQTFLEFEPLESGPWGYANARKDLNEPCIPENNN